jgi:uncharacterized membrane protein YkgB
MLWSFLAEFSSLLGVHPVSLHDIMTAVRIGSMSLTLVNMHIGMMRFVQAEAELAHAVTSHSVRPPLGTHSRPPAV